MYRGHKEIMGVPLKGPKVLWKNFEKLPKKEPSGRSRVLGV